MPKYSKDSFRNWRQTLREFLQNVSVSHNTMQIGKVTQTIEHGNEVWICCRNIDEEAFDQILSFNVVSSAAARCIQKGDFIKLDKGSAYWTHNFKTTSLTKEDPENIPLVLSSVIGAPQPAPSLAEVMLSRKD